jgi:hypothetical protein
MRRNVFLFLFIVVCFQLSMAQMGEVERWHLGGGVVFPTAPDQFYDYWKQGYQVIGGAEFSSSTRFIQIITAEFNYFPFDQERFLKRLGISNGSITINGSTTLMFSFEYLFKYPFIEYRSYQPSVFAGLGCLDILRTSTSVEYPYYPVSQESKNSIVAIIPFGASIKVFQREGKEIEVTFTYTIGLSKNQNINSNYTSLKLDYSFAP